MKARPGRPTGSCDVLPQWRPAARNFHDRCFRPRRIPGADAVLRLRPLLEPAAGLRRLRDRAEKRRRLSRNRDLCRILAMNALLTMRPIGHKCAAIFNPSLRLRKPSLNKRRLGLTGHNRPSVKGAHPDENFWLDAWTEIRRRSRRGPGAWAPAPRTRPTWRAPRRPRRRRFGDARLAAGFRRQCRRPRVLRQRLRPN